MEELFSRIKNETAYYPNSSNKIYERNWLNGKLVGIENRWHSNGAIAQIYDHDKETLIGWYDIYGHALWSKEYFDFWRRYRPIF